MGCNSRATIVTQAFACASFCKRGFQETKCKILWKSNIHHIHVSRSYFIYFITDLFIYVIALLVVTQRCYCRDFLSVSNSNFCFPPSVVCLSIIRKLRFLRNRDPGQSLWEAIYPPHLQYVCFFHFFQIFMFFNNIFFIIVSMGPYGNENFKMPDCQQVLSYFYQTL